MKALLTACRASAGLASMTLSLVLVAAALGLLPDRQGAVLQGRVALSETLALQCAVAAQRNDMDVLEPVLRTTVDRNADLLSAAVRGPKGFFLEVGDHTRHWGDVPADHSTPTHIHVPIVQGNRAWGRLELRFTPPDSSPMLAGISQPMLLLLSFLFAGGFLGGSVYLWILLRPLIVQAVPKRVRQTLNTLVEGVVILDKDRRIALANDAFAKLVSQPAETLQGRKVEELPWQRPQTESAPDEYPWVRSLEERAPQTRQRLNVGTSPAETRSVLVNSMTIVGDDGSRRGTLATFHDLTEVEQKNDELNRTVEELEASRAETKRQNLELQAQATRDPLTGCLNRRAFFADFETHWSSATRHKLALSCVMVDVDKFKAINDTYGHGKGDQVLQQVAETLKSTVRAADLVCRYGGEEFCVLLPHTDAAEAFEAAERFRQAIAARPLAGIPVTASFGAACIASGAREPRELLDQADKALYAAKRTGRNRVVLWSPDLPEHEGHKDQPAAPAPPREQRPDIPIPFHAVTALLSALAYRDAYTAEHSRRVADLCVATANGLLSQSRCYILEVAALLHDIGKLGVADAILRKPGPLDEQEWKAIRTHEHVGEEIITAAFTCAELAEIARFHHAWYAGTDYDPTLPRGEAIPLGARILSIADAYDAMVSDRVYRKGCSREKAFAELRRCAGRQFDPGLVERFIEVVEARDESRATPALCVSKQTALRIGMQIEKLAFSLDTRDRETLALMAGQLHATALECGISSMADAAAQLETTLAEERDWIKLMQQAMELMDLCRSTYDSYLPHAGTAAPAHAAIAPELLPSKA